jgi:hypothetical protein
VKFNQDRPEDLDIYVRNIRNLPLIITNAVQYFHSISAEKDLVNVAVHIEHVQVIRCDI